MPEDSGTGWFPGRLLPRNRRRITSPRAHQAPTDADARDVGTARPGGVRPAPRRRYRPYCPAMRRAPLLRPRRRGGHVPGPEAATLLTARWPRRRSCPRLPPVSACAPETIRGSRASYSQTPGPGWFPRPFATEPVALLPRGHHPARSAFPRSFCPGPCRLHITGTPAIHRHPYRSHSARLLFRHRRHVRGCGPGRARRTSRAGSAHRRGSRRSGRPGRAYHSERAGVTRGPVGYYDRDAHPAQ
jgi:hypothetical protein